MARQLAWWAALALAAALVTPASADEPNIGAAVAVTTIVTGATGGGEAMLATGDPIYANEVISTDDSGVGQFKFADDTLLAVGPRSSFTLDNFVFDPDKAGAQVAINMTRGAFRFITGNSPHQAYKLTTPTATLGLRGTAFDVYVADDGETVLAMLSGAVDICNRIGTCQVQQTIGTFLHVARDGAISIRDKWDGPVAEQVAFARALPFMAKEDILLPAFHSSRQAVTLYLERSGQLIERAGNTLERAGSTIERTIRHIPRPRLRNPFR